MKEISHVFESLKPTDPVVINMHQKPDPDAMGSALGLYHFIKKLGNPVVVISPTNWADFLKWMPGIEDVIDFESIVSTISPPGRNISNSKNRESERRDSNPRPRPWQGRALPAELLSH